MKIDLERPTGVALRLPRHDVRHVPQVSARSVIPPPRYFVAALMVGGLGYLLATASLATLLVVGGVLAVLTALLVSFGLYILNNTYEL
jgi:hypothetical protein